MPTGQGWIGATSTARLHLRPFEMSDLTGLAKLFAKSKVWQFPYGRGLTPQETGSFLEQQLLHWETYSFGCWLAEHRESGQTLGYVGLSTPTFLPEILPAVEVGWRFDPDMWGRGLASEGAVAALHAGFTTLGLVEICSVPQSDNAASVRVATRIGMDLAREVTIPSNDRRGAVVGSLFVATADAWQPPTRLE